MFYFSRSSFFRVIYLPSFFAGVKDIHLQKSKNLPFTNTTFFVFKIRFPLDEMCCENFGKFDQGKFKIKGWTIRKVMGGRGKNQKNSCKGKCQEKKFEQRRR